MRKAFVINPNGTRKEVTPTAEDGKFTLKEMQGFVGGLIEFIDPKRSTPYLAVVNEEYLYLPEEEENITAYFLVSTGIHAGQPTVPRGSVLITPREFVRD